MTKLTKWHVRPAKTQINLGIHPVWSESSLPARRNIGSLSTHWAHSEDTDLTGRIPRLIWVFAWCTLILFVLSRRGSNVLVHAVLIAIDRHICIYFVFVTPLSLYKPAPVAQSVECPLPGTGGHGFDPGPRQTKSFKMVLASPRLALILTG